MATVGRVSLSQGASPTYRCHLRRTPCTLAPQRGHAPAHVDRDIDRTQVEHAGDAE